MAKVLLLHPSFEGKFGGKPLGLVYVATALVNTGHHVKIIDLNAKHLSTDQLKERIKQYSPQYVGIASTSPTHLDACDVAQQVKEIGNIPVIKGGTHETYCSQTTLEKHPEIDISVRGSGEDTIVELIKTLERHDDLSGVAGIAFRDGENINITAERPLRKNLDEYPHPDRNLLEPSAFYNFDIFDGTATTQVRMSRGCSYGCNFCPIDRTYLFHSADYVLEELRQIKEQGYGALFWDDAIFTANRRLVEDILNRVISEGLAFQMGAQTRADVHITPEMVRLMKKAGFEYLSFGMESGDQDILSGYNKRLRIEDVESAVRLTKEQGVQTAVTAIVGAPDETLESVQKTVDAINRIGPNAVSWSAYSIYPGSLLEFDPAWYEDPTLSREAIWRNFDEGYKAKHARSIEYITQALELIRRTIDPRIKM